MANAFHCAKCTETCHRSLCNYFLHTLKNKRRRQNKFGVAALFPRFTTKRIPFARNFVQMDPTCSPLQIAFQLFFADSKNKRRRQNKFGVAALFRRFTAKGSCLHESLCKWDLTCSPLQIAFQLFFAESKE